MIRLLSVKLADDQADQVRRNQHAAIEELQSLIMAGARVIEDVTLVEGATTKVAHKLGRVPLIVLPSPPRGAASHGRIDEVRDGTFKRDQFVGLRAVGYGASITVDVLVL